MSRADRGEAPVLPFSFDRVFSEDRLRGSDVREQERKGFEEARREGEKAGFEQGLQKADATLEHLRRLILELERYRTELYVKIEEEMLGIIFRIAEKVIHREIRADASIQRSIVAEGLKKLREEGDILIRVSPADYVSLQEALPELCRQNGVPGRVVLQEDASVTKGGCILETDRCELDARIESSLKNIEEALRSK